MGIIDRRELEFDARALVSVVAGSGDRAQAIGLPPLKPSAVAFDAQGNRITFRYADHDAVEVTAAHLGALLMSYCIPCPAFPTSRSGSSRTPLSSCSAPTIPTRRRPEGITEATDCLPAAPRWRRDAGARRSAG